MRAKSEPLSCIAPIICRLIMIVSKLWTNLQTASIRTIFKKCEVQKDRPSIISPLIVPFYKIQFIVLWSQKLSDSISIANKSHGLFHIFLIVYSFWCPVLSANSMQLYFKLKNNRKRENLQKKNEEISKWKAHINKRKLNKDIGDRRNISVKLQCVYVCLSFGDFFYRQVSSSFSYFFMLSIFWYFPFHIVSVF